MALKLEIMPNFLQINLNHCASAQDLMLQEMSEHNIDIIIVAEPYRIPDNAPWFADTEGKAAIAWNPTSRPPCVLLCKGAGYVGVKRGDLLILSCYVSPNSEIAVFENFLQKIALTIAGNPHKYLILAGDFNAKALLWGSPKSNLRGEILEEWMNTQDLRLANLGDEPTCVRYNGSSIVDLTWVSPSLIPNIQEWRVLTERESLSDHKFILYQVTIGESNYTDRKFSWPSNPRWATQKINRDVFDACIFASCMGDDKSKETSPDVMASELIQSITDACDASMPRTQRRRYKSTYWWTPTISLMRDECVKTRRALSRARRRNKKNLMMETKFNIIPQLILRRRPIARPNVN